jgi:hypothetical protein
MHKVPAENWMLTSLRMLLLAVIISPGCKTPAKSPGPFEAINTSNEEHRRRFGDFTFQKLGSVENSGLQVPVVSPDGSQILYLRTNCKYVSPGTLLGSPDPKDTPETGRLTVWLRPTTGAGLGRELSPHRWSHSPAWSNSGDAVVYVTNTPPSSAIIHTDMTTGRQTVLGMNGMINCLPRFDTDDRTVLFCAGTDPKGPFRIYRQSVQDKKPIPLTLPGVDCLFPLFVDDTKGVICARADGENIKWVQARSGGFRDLTKPCGYATRPAVLQTLAGIPNPFSLDHQSFAFYDAKQNRTCVYHLSDNVLRAHHLDSVAACWLTDNAMALATNEWLFIVNTTTGMSLQVLNGGCIPARYVPASRKLILFGKDVPHRLSIMEINFKDRKVK